MGFSGSFVVARSRQPLLTLPFFSGESALRTEEKRTDCFRMLPARGRGWQAVRVNDLLADGPAWLRALVEATGSPALIASVFDSDVCEVSGLTPRGAIWTAVLDGEVPTPAGVALAIAAWSAAAGLKPDRVRLTRILTKKKDPFVEVLFYELLTAAGLPEEAPFVEEDADEENQIHPHHRPDGAWQGESTIEHAILGMSRDSDIVLRCQAAFDCHIHVRFRLDGSYELEYRDRIPEEHFRTRTLSQEKVVAALTGWAAGEIAWRDRFQWLQGGAG